MSSVHRRRIFGDKLLVPRYSVPFVYLFVDGRRCSSCVVICNEAVMPFEDVGCELQSSVGDRDVG